MPFRFLDHVADIVIRVDAPDLESLLSDAGRALTAVMVDLDAVTPVDCVKFSVSGRDEQDLLYNFLEELLVYKDADALVFSQFDVSLSREGGSLIARVRACGERVRSKHNPRADVKAISWHGFKVWYDASGWHAEVLLDL